MTLYDKKPVPVSVIIRYSDGSIRRAGPEEDPNYRMEQALVRSHLRELPYGKCSVMNADATPMSIEMLAEALDCFPGEIVLQVELTLFMPAKLLLSFWTHLHTQEPPRLISAPGTNPIREGFVVSPRGINVLVRALPGLRDFSILTPEKNLDATSETRLPLLVEDLAVLIFHK